MENCNFHLFAAIGKGNSKPCLFAANRNGKPCLFTTKGNGKQKFVVFGQQTINGNQQLLFQQM
jgi:hypothetical protein